MSLLNWFAAAAAGSLFLAGSVSWAEDAQPELVTSPVVRVFVPQGFDGNDNVEVTVHGEFPNTCYKTGPVSASVDYATQTVTVEATAYLYSSLMCAQMIVPFTESVSLGTVRPGTYRVIVKDRPAAETTDLVVGRPTTDSPDDYLYAPVDAASIVTGADGSQSVVITGHYPYTFVGCMVVGSVRVQQTPGNVVVVQPIAKLTDGDACLPQAHTKLFVISTPLTSALSVGDHLVHVRVLSGRSLNQLVVIEGNKAPIK